MSKKILMVSMPSLHFFRWTNQLKDSGFEVFWFDITGSGIKNEQLNWVTQFVDWKLRLDFPGRYLLKSKLPKIYEIFQKFNDRDVNIEFEKFVEKIQPDIVHSFALYLSCSPILSTMLKYPNLKWIYSSWGSDLYYFKNNENYLLDIKKVLPRVDYLFTDCQRDFLIAKELGFQGQFLGVFPGGGGFDLDKLEKWIEPLEERNTILIKGFQGRSGRCIQVLKALSQLKESLNNFNIIVFGADSEVIEFVKNSKLNNWDNFEVLKKIKHEEVLKLMGKTLVYIGNSNSDGMPNTLLESIIMGAFPIQSNPGGTTEELIKHKKNGLLIEDCEDVDGISKLMKFTLNNLDGLVDSHNYNLEKIRHNFDYSLIREKVLNAYNSINLAERT